MREETRGQLCSFSPWAWLGVKWRATVGVRYNISLTFYRVARVVLPVRFRADCERGRMEGRPFRSRKKKMAQI